MAEKSVECNNVSIRYITGDLKAIGLKEYVIRHINRTYHVDEFWADRDINFSLEPGDMLGIIGTNGAGKSTLLKAVTGIMKPGKGSVTTRGKIAAILELSSGFDGDMTVRENTFLRGAMLGYTKAFITEKYDEIIEFAGLEKFQDRTFKQLSSGMRSRLAFSIACLVNPDILILDEVLSVGDGAFRKKSGDKMKEILSSGVTSILVSHSIMQVRDMCNKVLWIDHGNQVIFSDDVDHICDAYEGFLLGQPLPKNAEDMNKLAIFYNHETERARAEKTRQDAMKMMSLLEEGKDDASIAAAINVLAKHNPELLNISAVQKSDVAASVDIPSDKKD